MLKYFLTILTLLFHTAYAAEVEFQVEPDATQIEEGENLSLDFVVTADSTSAKIEAPGYDAPDFEEVNVYQRGTSIQSTYINGQFSAKKSERITVVLLPKKTGNLKINNITVTVNGKKYSTDNLNIEVAKSGTLKRGGAQQNLFSQGMGIRQHQQNQQLPSSGAAPNQGRQNSIFIRTEPDKLKLYKGELMTLEYVLYTKVQIAGFQVERFPTASGFLKEDIDVPVLRNVQGLEWKRTVVNGQQYYRAVLAKYALFPVRDGQLPLDVFNAKVSFRGGSSRLLDDEDEGAFGLNQFFQSMQVMTESRESDRKTVEVLPLPAEGQPGSFSGLVGNFDISADINKPTLKAGESFQLKVKIEGKGHAGSLEKLQVAWPQDFELYEDKSSTKFQANGRSERVFEFLVIPRVKGQFTIPPIEVSMFDPETKGYKTKKTQSFTLDVLEGDGSGVSTVATGGSKISKQAAAPKDILYLKDSKPLGFMDRTLPPLINILVALNLIVLAGFLVVLAVKSLKPQVSVTTVKDWKNLIKSLEQEVDSDPVKVLGLIDQTLGDILEKKLGVAKGSLVVTELKEELQKKNLDDDAMQRIISLIELSENQRFLPPQLANNPAVARKALNELKHIVEGLA